MDHIRSVTHIDSLKSIQQEWDLPDLLDLLDRQKMSTGSLGVVYDEQLTREFDSVAINTAWYRIRRWTTCHAHAISRNGNSHIHETPADVAKRDSGAFA